MIQKDAAGGDVDHKLEVGDFVVLEGLKVCT
jgi:hypothetical protein